MGGHIVVGVDGSPESDAALRWAVDEARLRDVALDVVTVWTYPMPAFVGIPGGYASIELGEDLERRAKEAQAEALARTVPEQAGVVLEARVVKGQPAWALVDAAQDADMLVVGSRGLGGFRELLLGSVSQQCAHHAVCPVVIVRRPPSAP